MSIVTQNFSRNKYFNWAVKNLFSSWVNTIMTIIAIIFVYEIGSFFLNWSILVQILGLIFKEKLLLIELFALKI